MTRKKSAWNAKHWAYANLLITIPHPQFTKFDKFNLMISKNNNNKKKTLKISENNQSFFGVHAWTLSIWELLILRRCVKFTAWSKVTKIKKTILCFCQKVNGIKNKLSQQFSEREKSHQVGLCRNAEIISFHFLTRVPDQRLMKQQLDKSTFKWKETELNTNIVWCVYVWCINK